MLYSFCDLYLFKDTNENNNVDYFKEDLYDKIKMFLTHNITKDQLREYYWTYPEDNKNFKNEYIKTRDYFLDICNGTEYDKNNVYEIYNKINFISTLIFHRHKQLLIKDIKTWNNLFIPLLQI